MSTNGILRKLGLTAGFALLAFYAVATLRGPHGIAALRKQYEEIRVLQSDVDALKQEVKERKERNQRLRENPAEQEVEIRRRLKLLRKGEKTFIYPESSSGSAKPEPQTNTDER